MKYYKTIDLNGRITIPKHMRKRLDLHIYDEVEIECDENKIVVTKPNNSIKGQLIKAIEEGAGKETLLELIEKL